jgi:hypothetical protein
MRFGAALGGTLYQGGRADPVLSRRPALRHQNLRRAPAGPTSPPVREPSPSGNRDEAAAPGRPGHDSAPHRGFPSATAQGCRGGTDQDSPASPSTTSSSMASEWTICAKGHATIPPHPSPVNGETPRSLAIAGPTLHRSATSTSSRTATRSRYRPPRAPSPTASTTSASSILVTSACSARIPTARPRSRSQPVTRSTPQRSDS